MRWATSPLSGVLRHFTTDQAVRAGVITAAWAAAASYTRGLLPRTPVQQAAATGATVATHYAVGATLWSGVASTAAGLPGSRAGTKALLAAATLSAVGGKGAEVALRPASGQNLAYGLAWSQVKLLSVVGLAGGLVTLSDVVLHDVAGVRRSPGTTLALDLALGGVVAGGTWIRRRRRAQKYLERDLVADVDVLPPEKPKPDQSDSLLQRGRTAVIAGGTVAGTAFGLGTLAVVEQALSRQVAAGVNRLAGEDLGEFSTWVGHGVSFLGFGAAGVLGLRQVRALTQRKSEIIEPAYQLPPVSSHVSCGPNSEVSFEAVGKEGRRFVLMALSSADISEVMGEEAENPVRVIVPREGSIAERAACAVRELIATGGIDRSLICVASPTGVGYVNYVMAEALEYLARGDCAIVVPQYAYLPSALALNKTNEGTELQTQVILAIQAELDRRGVNPRPRIVQFGESLGAQVAADVGGVAGINGFDEVGLDSGLYLGVPFRTALWRAYRRDPAALDTTGRLVLVSEAGELGPGAGRHVMIVHHDDPINKFGYSMVVQRPWWMGPPSTRPPRVPRESLFRPITTFVLALVDLVNGMNSKPGQFRLQAHDYRIDLREALQRTYNLAANADQEARIEWELRQREQEWAERRLIAKTGEKALRSLRDTINSWGQDTVNLRLDEHPTDDASNRLIEYLNQRLGTQGG